MILAPKKKEAKTKQRFTLMRSVSRSIAQNSEGEGEEYGRIQAGLHPRDIRKE
jgi:hypothetical protein